MIQSALTYSSIIFTLCESDYYGVIDLLLLPIFPEFITPIAVDLKVMCVKRHATSMVLNIAPTVLCNSFLIFFICECVYEVKWKQGGLHSVSRATNSSQNNFNFPLCVHWFQNHCFESLCNILQHNMTSAQIIKYIWKCCKCFVAVKTFMMPKNYKMDCCDILKIMIFAINLILKIL